MRSKHLLRYPRALHSYQIRRDSRYHFLHFVSDDWLISTLLPVYLLWARRLLITRLKNLSTKLNSGVQEHRTVTPLISRIFLVPTPSTPRKPTANCRWTWGGWGWRRWSRKRQRRQRNGRKSLFSQPTHSGMRPILTKHSRAPRRQIWPGMQRAVWIIHFVSINRMTHAW